MLEEAAVMLGQETEENDIVGDQNVVVCLDAQVRSTLGLPLL